MYVKKKSNAKTNVISYLRVPEYGMTNGSNLRVAFTTDSTPKRGKKGQQKKVTCVKRVKAKTGVTSHLISVYEYGITNASNNSVSVAIPLTATPKGGNKTYIYFWKSS